MPARTPDMLRCSLLILHTAISLFRLYRHISLFSLQLLSCYDIFAAAAAADMSALTPLLLFMPYAIITRDMPLFLMLFARYAHRRRSSVSCVCRCCSQKESLYSQCRREKRYARKMFCAPVNHHDPNIGTIP